MRKGEKRTCVAAEDAVPSQAPSFAVRACRPFGPTLRGVFRQRSVALLERMRPAALPKIAGELRRLCRRALGCRRCVVMINPIRCVSAVRSEQRPGGATANRNRSTSGGPSGVPAARQRRVGPGGCAPMPAGRAGRACRGQHPHDDWPCRQCTRCAAPTSGRPPLRESGPSSACQAASTASRGRAPKAGPDRRRRGSSGRRRGVAASHAVARVCRMWPTSSQFRQKMPKSARVGRTRPKFGACVRFIARVQEGGSEKGHKLGRNSAHTTSGGFLALLASGPGQMWTDRTARDLGIWSADPDHVWGRLASRTSAGCLYPPARSYEGSPSFLKAFAQI